MRSIFSGQLSTWRPLWSSGADRSEPKATSNRRGTSASGDSASSRTKFSRSRQSPSSSSPPQVAELDPDAAVDRLREAGVEEGEGVVETISSTRSVPSSFGSPEKNLKSVWWAIEPRSRVNFAVDRARVDQPLEEPDRRAVGEELEAR